MSIFLLANEFPMLARELETLLIKCGEMDLADQIWQLRIVDRCRCEDDFCSSFYTKPSQDKLWGTDCRTLDLPCEDGYLILDVTDGQIVFVEVLYREDIHQKLIEILP